MTSEWIKCIGRLLAFLVVVSLPAVATGTSEKGRYPQYYAITAPKLELNPTESVYGFTLDTIGAMIVRMSVPMYWNVNIDKLRRGPFALNCACYSRSVGFRGEGSSVF